MKKITVFLVPLFIFTISFCISGYFSTIGTDPHHDGIVLKPAIDLAEGKMLFKETFTQYGALTTILQALSIEIFGEYLLVIKLLTALFYGLISLLIYKIWSQFLTKKLALFAWIIWLFLSPFLSVVFLPWSSVYALFFQCFAIYFVLKYLKNKNANAIVLAGICGGLTFWSKQNVGAYTILASITSIMLIQFFNKKKALTYLAIVFNYLLGTILISLPFLLWIIVNGAVIDWWKQSILFAVFWAESSKLSFFNHFFPRSLGNISIWALMPIITLFAFFREIFSKKANLNILTVSIFGLFSWLQYFPIPDIRHAYWSSTIMIGLTIYFFAKLSKSITNNKLGKYLIFILFFFIIFTPDLKSGIKNGYIKGTQSYEYLNKPSVMKGMKLSKSEAIFYSRTYESIIEYEAEQGKTNMITTGRNALYLTFTNSENFHPIYVNWELINNSHIYTDYLKKMNSYIISKKPLIIARDNQVIPGYCKLNEFVNIEDGAFLLAPCM